MAGNVSELISPEGGSYEVTNTRVISATEIKMLAVLLVLTAFVSVLLSLLRDAMRERNK